MKSNIIKRIFILAGIFAAALSCKVAELETDSVDLGKLLRPVSLTASPISAECIRLGWKSTADKVVVEYSTVADLSDNVTNLEIEAEGQYDVTGLNEGTVYYFRLKALAANEETEDSEFSEIIYAKTPLEPRIPNVKASSSMEYVLDPWSVTVTLVLTWDKLNDKIEPLTDVRLVPAAGGEALMFALDETAYNDMTVTLTEGIQTDTEYTIDLLNGSKVRGSVVHKTVPGPVPAIEGKTSLDFGTEPVSAVAEFTWRLYYEPEDVLKEIVLTKDGTETVVSVTEEDKTADKVTVTGLATSAVYKVELKSNDGRVIAGTEIITPDAPSSDMEIVRPGDDLAAVLNDPDRKEIIYLVAGNHEINLSETRVYIEKNLVITSDSPTSTSLKLTGNFTGKGTMEQIVFQNISISCSGYLLQIKTEAYEIGLLGLDNCVIDLNSAATGSSTLFSTAGTASQVLKELKVSNSLIYSNAAQSQGILYNLGSGSTSELQKVSLLNSTFANTGRGLVSTNCTNDYAFDILMENCTLYGLESASNVAMFDIRYSGANCKANSKVNINNSVVWFGGTKTPFKLLQLGSGVSNIAESSHFYVFTGQETALPNGLTLTVYNGKPESFWANPGTDPTAEGVSFKLKDETLRALWENDGIYIGDPNWETK